MSLVRPSFSHNFLKRLNIWSIDSLPLHLILITDDHNLPCFLGSARVFEPTGQIRMQPALHSGPDIPVWLLSDDDRQECLSHHDVIHKALMDYNDWRERFKKNGPRGFVGSVGA